MNVKSTIAYFSMEIGLSTKIPTYSGGLGVLAGDTIRAAADLNVPMVAMTLLYRKGHFQQKIDEHGRQQEHPVRWEVDEFLTGMPQRASVIIEGREVYFRSWRYDVSGVGGFSVPVYFLDADLPENSNNDRVLTDCLYGGDQRYRLCQEIILGFGGVRMLRELGYNDIKLFHMNEGHASFITVELLNEEMRTSERTSIDQDTIELVRDRCIFTTHTPVPAGHDKYPMDLVEQVLGDNQAFKEIKYIFHYEGVLNMTYLALNLSRYINGVAKSHGEVSRMMFSGYDIEAITNGVHATTWVSEPFQELYDQYIPEWRQNNFALRYALSIPQQDIWLAHAEAKKSLIRYVNQSTGSGMDEHILTIGFARRATVYKRANLVFLDMERLRQIAREAGPVQLVFAGKAHPQDEEGKELIKRILYYREKLGNVIKIAYLENYTMDLAKLVIAGCDVWLNTPKPPLEASGTSGMKAAFNGVPSLSVLDGWWIEGHLEGITGWAIGPQGRKRGEEVTEAEEAQSLYDKLSNDIIPLFYNDRERFISVMRHCIAINGSFFNVHRMMQEYVLNAYFH
ncbi:MAG: alpha-glucan family phosphorylase [Alphaproteobacteria bacterium]|uniref:Alpha-glucan family phosphorylase n=1 Tax=Candidatus Nitrobium versatile TaxID=2884831 RepID=A0A953JEU7_9BACT|nr:alpha-glucan family phosphorylase [Candidatus Nitrobium versatile]